MTKQNGQSFPGRAPGYVKAGRPFFAEESALWEQERRYWQKEYVTRPYMTETMDYMYYEPAYGYGVELYGRYKGQRYEELDETALRREWEKRHPGGELPWERAQVPIRDAYDRLYYR